MVTATVSGRERLPFAPRPRPRAPYLFSACPTQLHSLMLSQLQSLPQMAAGTLTYNLLYDRFKPATTARPLHLTQPPTPTPQKTRQKRGGPGALYLGFLPFCLESIPFDMVELCTFSYLGDAYAAAQVNDGRGCIIRWVSHGQTWMINADDVYCHQLTVATYLFPAPNALSWYPPTAQRDPRLRSFTERLGPHVADLAIGGASGAAAVLISMPFDCIKTYLQARSLSSAIP